MGLTALIQAISNFFYWRAEETKVRVIKEKINAIKAITETLLKIYDLRFKADDSLWPDIDKLELLLSGFKNILEELPGQHQTETKPKDTP